MLRCLRTVQGSHKLQPQRLPLVVTQQRELRKGKAPKKPKYRVKMDYEGNIKPPAKLPGYQPDEVESFRKWLNLRATILKAETSTSVSDRFKAQLNEQVKAYFETKYGQRMSAVRARAKKKVRIARKNRREKLLTQKLEEWNTKEDMKENLYLRHTHYGLEGFTWKGFLQAHREKVRPLPVIETEEEFKKRLDSEVAKHLRKAPKMSRKKIHYKSRLNYDKEMVRKYLGPWAHEIRRRALVWQLVNEREDAIAQVKWRQMVEQKRKERVERKQKECLRKLRHWNKVLGNWHEKNHHLRQMKINAVLHREQIMDAARDEFLRAINDGSKHWENSPDECRFLRFRFAFGVELPFTPSKYL